MKTFREFRELVSVLQVASHLGYKPLKGKTTPIRPVLRNALGDTILIKNPNHAARQLYMSLSDDNDRGSVIDFVQRRKEQFSNFTFRNEIDATNKILSFFCGESFDYKKMLDDNNLSPERNFSHDEMLSRDAKIYDLKYLLNERSLSAESVLKFLPFIKIVKNGTFNNIGFPFTNFQDDKIRGFEIRNFNFKSFSSGGDKVFSAWNAVFAPTQAMVKEAYFFESAIDAISFYDLYNKRIDTHAAFVSFGGNLSRVQTAAAINAFPSARINTCFDNDLAGKMYDIEVACIKEGLDLKKRKHGDSIRFEVNNKSFPMKIDKFSLKGFFKNANFSPQTEIHKPKGKDWNEAVSQAREVNSGKKKNSR